MPVDLPVHGAPCACMALVTCRPPRVLLLVQLNCRLELLKIKVLLTSFASAIDVDLDDNLLVAFDVPSATTV